MSLPNDTLFPDYRYQDYLFSNDKTKLQPAVIFRFLDQDSYWAQGIPYDTVLRAIAGSVCIGIYDNNNIQVGFGRMITDQATFAYLADVFVVKEHRGKGLSKALMKGFCNLADTFRVRRFLLTTQDAHGLYRQCGFEPFPYPERLMSRAGVTYQVPQ